MILRSVVLIAAFLSPILFPWPLTALLALIAAAVSPLAPLAVGLIIDTLYFSRTASLFVPWATILGAVATLGAFSVHRFLETSIMR
jgi:hypothetical protein